MNMKAGKMFILRKYIAASMKFERLDHHFRAIESLALAAIKMLSYLDSKASKTRTLKTASQASSMSVHAFSLNVFSSSYSNNRN